MQLTVAVIFAVSEAFNVQVYSMDSIKPYTSARLCVFLLQIETYRFTQSTSKSN